MRRRLVLASGVVLGLVAGCASDDGERQPGDPVTRAEAGVLAELLHRNHERGGADFVLTAPYAEDELLTLTGEVDFRESVATGEAVLSFSDGRDDRSLTVTFTPEDIWFGDVPGLTGADAGATLLRRPVVTDDGDGPPRLLDVAVELLLNLSSRRDDAPDAFLDGKHTWQGQRSIDGRLTTVFGLPEGRRVAVSAADDLMAQFVTPLGGDDVQVTVTLSGHGSRSIEPPGDEGTAEASDHPEVVAALGL
ncbi:hypothetical protein [Blastococcus sp. PRF04-17]|uniref:hypothetical protein n=1 Tax=Blastococcus sp. PRF04-17 TaxID=2933797 RepID=UPI001FF26615|nr:hypothetical protein [Blastococcus sp. PRF04-17]UOY00581.1 hypothetical protein MVA48_16485 [Blastococcus sp. PRF04-17]